MVAAPTLLRDVDALPRFYRAVAAGAGLPLIVQDEPAATGVVIPVSILLAVLEASGARTVKLEDPPTPPKIGRLLAADPGLAVFGGLGGAAALWELERGACGTMTGFAYPEILRAIRLAHESGEAGRGGPPLRPVPAAHRVRGAADGRSGHPQGGAPATRSHRPFGDPGGQGPLDPATVTALDAIFERLAMRPSLEPFRPDLSAGPAPIAGDRPWTSD